MTTSITKQFRVFRGPSAVVNAMGPNVLALAGFDGVHMGHQALLRRAAEEAAERGLPVGAATFDDRKRARRGVSTTRIRERLVVGDVEAVNQLLGRPYALTATVRDGTGGWTDASVPASRVIPAAGDYRVALEFTSRSDRALVESVATVCATGAEASGRVRIALDHPVDHGRLRLVFLARCTATEVTRPAKHRFEPVVTASPRYEVR